MSLYQIKTAVPCSSDYTYTKYIDAKLVPASNCTASVDNSCKVGFKYVYTCQKTVADITPLSKPYYLKTCIKNNETNPYSILYTRLSNACELTESYQFLKNTCDANGINENSFSDNKCSEPLNSYVTPWDDPTHPDCSLKCVVTNSSTSMGFFMLLVLFHIL
eukprot:NODE_59_length_28102_cov_0.971110.p21 type:complete len:162 gc:universal NODE_59_length_28102_cov_0.971110:3981-3496(-)